jgi:hypothetical protein
LATGHSAKVADLELKVQSLEVRLVVAESDSLDAKALSLLVQDEVIQSGQSVMEGVIDRVGVLERSRSGGVNFGAPPSTATGGTDTLAKVTELIERVANLEDATTLIKFSLGGDSIMVGGEAHHTPEGLTGWVIKNVSSQNNCPTQMIIDIVSLLEQLQDINKSSDAKLLAKAQAWKGGFLSLSLAHAITSYSVLIPASFLGGTDDDLFSKIKSYKKWSDPRISFVKSISDKGVLTNIVERSTDQHDVIRCRNAVRMYKADLTQPNSTKSQIYEREITTALTHQSGIRTGIGFSQ